MRRPKTGEYVGKREKVAERQHEQKELHKAGWRTKANLPYTFAHTLNLPSKRIHIEKQMGRFIESALQEIGTENRSAHEKIFGRTQYVSPEVVKKVDALVRADLFGSDEKRQSAAPETRPDGV